MSDSKIRILKLNVLYHADVDSAATVVEKEAGSLDVIIFNAGTTNNGSLVKSNDDQFQAMVGINTVAPSSRYSSPLFDSQGAIHKDYRPRNGG